MAFTYLILNIAIVAVAVLVLRVQFKKPSVHWWITLATLLVLTLVFDNIFINLGMFDYNPDLILGTTIGSAPVEDFLYSLLACIIVPSLWNRSKLSNHEGKK